jgi:hypothetical protein
VLIFVADNKVITDTQSIVESVESTRSVKYVVHRDVPGTVVEIMKSQMYQLLYFCTVLLYM